MEPYSLGLKVLILNLELFFSLTLSFWKSNTRKGFAVNEDDLIRRIIKFGSSSIAPVALGPSLIQFTSQLIYCIYVHTI